MPGNVLIVSRYFPPGGGVGAFRAAKFVKYLPEFGWDPYVVSLPKARQEQLLPDDIDKNQYSSIAKMPTKRIYVDVPFSTVSTSLGDSRRLPILAKKIPELVNSYDIDVVFHTAPPFYSLLNVAWMSKVYDFPYVTDFRDPWYLTADVFDHTSSISNPILTTLNKKFEEVVVSNSDRVILNTPKMGSLYQRVYPENSGKFNVIPNGYDPVDYDVDPVEKPAFVDLQIVYPGRFRKNMDGFLTALKSLSEEISVRLVHLGDDNRPDTKAFFDQATQMGLSDVIEKKGYSDFDTVVSYIKGSDIGLVATRQDDPTHVPTKTYDYIACSIPILALDSEHGSVTEIIETFEHASHSSHDDPKQIRSVLNQIAKKQPNQLDSQEQLDQYTRKQLTEQLADVLNNVK